MIRRPLPLFALFVLTAACGSNPPPAPEVAPPPPPPAPEAPPPPVDAGAPLATAVDAAPPEAPPPAAPAVSKKITIKHDPAWAACHATYKPASKDLVAEALRSGKGCEKTTKMKPILTPQKGTQSDRNPPQEIKFEGKAGKCYRVYGMADAGIKDLDLVVKDSKGVVAAEDSTDDPSPVLLEDGAFCFAETDDAVLVVSVGQGKGNWALQIWSD